ncbi:hypothetical protein ACQGS5_27800 [Bacillus sp. GKis3/1]|uniref:hypothetical protein n=1 Tax=Bacillus sp. GKis3/1 TaxID=3418492 RepID=UPI003CEE5E7A
MMFWIGIIIGFVSGSFVTCGLLYFGFRAEENERAAMQRKAIDELEKKEMEQLK